MADYVTIDTGPLKKELAARAKSAERASMWAVRESARVAKRAAKARVRVYQGAGVSVASVKKARRAGVTLSGATLGRGQTVEGNAVVRGLLKASISSSRRLTEAPSGTYVVKVAPRGPRVHKYARKIEALDGYMAAGHAAAAAEMGAIHARAWSRALNG